ncbi:MAG: polysaccharide deacetylase family protein [Actinomycetia bacterium]|nr:polysaccharide deacetylase family protein [Actinomycetes bacterium]
MRRRTFLLSSTVSLAGVAAALTGCAAAAIPADSSAPTAEGPTAPTAKTPPSPTPTGTEPSETPTDRPPTATRSAPSTPSRAPSDQRGSLDAPIVLGALPGAGNKIALTIDDGVSAEVIDGYLRLAERHGTKLTFFINGMYKGWTTHAQRIGKLVHNGQVQIGNHTWSHPDLTKLSAAGIADQLGRNDELIQRLWGITSKPYMRPPYGYRDATTDRICADLGYPKITMWYGSLDDYGKITADAMVKNARKWLLPQRIVVGHANTPTVVGGLPRLQALLKKRGLTTVTLREVFGG